MYVWSVGRNAHWQCLISPGTYRLAINAERRTRVDVAITALTDPLAAPVAAHGILGQGPHIVSPAST